MWERPPYHNQIEQKQTNIPVDGRYLLSTFSCRTLEILVLTSPSFGTKMIPRFCALHQRAICGASGGSSVALILQNYCSCVGPDTEVS